MRPDRRLQSAAGRRPSGQPRKRRSNRIKHNANTLVDDLAYDRILGGKVMINAAALDAHSRRDRPRRRRFITAVLKQVRRSVQDLSPRADRLRYRLVNPKINS